MPTQSQFVAGKVDQAVNEAVVDILPGLHVQISQYFEPNDTWTFHLGLPTAAVLEVGRSDSLEQIIAAAEQAAKIARAQLFAALGMVDPELGEEAPRG